jgi:Ring finger domain
MSSIGRINVHCDDDDEFLYIDDSPKHPSSSLMSSATTLQLTLRDDRQSSNEQYHLHQQQEENESIELARRLMAEEAMASYEQHFQLLRESADQLSQEDYDALQRALGENEYEADGQDENGELSYDAMLDLSERIGDVKTERWAMIAATEVNKLPTFHFSQSVTLNGGIADIDDSERKCLVCQFEYETNESLRRLPCGHCFHKCCVDMWLQEKDVCPYCRQCIVKRN